MEGAVNLLLVDGVLVLTLANASKANSLTPSVIEGLEAGVRRGLSEDVRVLLLAAEGDNFCSGGDMRYLSLDDGGAGREYIAKVTDILSALRQFPKPVVAAIQGHAVGGGAEIACEADLRVLSTEASIRFSDVLIGSTPATVFRLVRLVNLGIATQMTLLGREMRSEEALSCGLAFKVVERGELFESSMEVARRLASLSSLSLRLAKQALAVAQSADGMTDLQVNLEAEAACYASPEMRRAIEEFMERKKEVPG